MRHSGLRYGRSQGGGCPASGDRDKTEKDYANFALGA